MGVVVTAIIQALASGLGLVVVGVPAAGLLTAVILVLCLAQLGPTLILLPVVIWLFWTGENVLGTVLLVWAIPVGMMDSFLRPILIRRGADLPLLLVFAGVVGGLLSMGMMGIFVGPTVLAVTFTLLQAWVKGHHERREAVQPDPAARG
jgi:predicted PurR-regulated permease PerM